MKRTLPPAIAILFAFTLAGGPPLRADSADGKQIFLGEKCNLCHSVSTAGIEATTQSDKLKGPDLVDLTADAEQLVRYLRREAEIDGKKHGKGFKGSDDELNAMVGWLLKQRT